MSIGVRLQSRETGGAREEINLVQMVSDLNRGSGERSLATMDSWRDLERVLNRAIAEGREVRLDIRIDYVPYGPPRDFEVKAWDAAGRILMNGVIKNA